MKNVPVSFCARKSRGFTLTELLIVIAVVALLAAIAIPSYRNQVAKTNRSNAMAVLQGFSQAMERFYAQNNTYVGAAVGTVYPSQSPLDGAARYSLSIVSQSSTAYQLRATPVGTQVGDGYLELLSTGERRWDRNNNNSIDSNENTW
ncbi:MAG: type IV pilin protein [Spongiibacteraceae bacterium]